MSIGHWRAIACAAMASLLIAPVLAPASAQQAREAKPLPVEQFDVRQMYVTSLGRVSEKPFDDDPLLAPQGTQCQEVSALPSQGFDGGTYFVQAGFVEQEIAAVSYTLDPSLFPIRIDLIEALIGTGPSGTSVPTTTEYSILVWDGTPDTGTLVFTVSSDGTVIPHVELPALSQAQAVNINFLIDPGDPEQIFINNTGGSNTFSVGIRIDEHNSQIGTGCFPAPSQTANAFPMTDTDGANQTQNWIDAIDCGPLGCPAGWSSFAQFPALCTPSGDWMIRATWTSFTCSETTGACCETDGSCSELTQAECSAAGGAYQGDSTTCAGVTCPLPTGACCLSNDNCLLLEEAACDVVGGTWQGAGSECNGSVCPRGAACLPDGTCVENVTELEAEMLGGIYLGDDTTCADADCPQPLGACCVTTTLACLILTEMDCGLVPDAVWLGADSICDENGDTIPDGGCNPPEPDCPGDVNGDGSVNDSDYFAWVTAFVGNLPECDVNRDQNCSDSDYFAWVTAFINGC